MTPVRTPRRLYLRIYLVVLAILGTLIAVGMIWWHLHTDPRTFGRALADFRSGLDHQLSADLSERTRQARLDAWASRTGANLALFGPDGRLQAISGPGVTQGVVEHAPRIPEEGAYLLGLAGGRVLVMRPRPDARLVPGPGGTAAFFAVVALLAGIGCYPLVRGLTRRLERLQRDVDAWGGTDQLPRVAVDGRDEIAALARSFNDAAQRIETLMRAQKSLLANASHELRSPLARIRIAIELLPTDTSPSLRAEIARNIRELDALVDEVLLSSRLDAVGGAALHCERVDLASLVRAIADGAAVTVRSHANDIHGDPRLLMRLLRNLVENAHRHGRGSAVEVILQAEGAGLRIEVCDRGPGLAPDQCARVFEPFYRAPGTSETDGGVGLGLSLVQQIANLHGGRVACHPRLGGGSCFAVWLPGLPAADR
ncbi:sensor histidine kinase [Cognatilysobacter bugurensis]|uniref:histidine kinase n=1 Tax=Cognatilysobacter bugurensis TaxID=543356 RepID=A0A918WAR0_9GAMM|nr:HAMP domain-containing sensor histidine kinase [Lysobacter bugurensis]GHA86507.1 sensor histidine kinase [Lysobacter bugurensis]